MTTDERTEAVVAAVGALVTTVMFMLEGGIMTAAVVVVLEVDGVMLLMLTLVDDMEVVELVDTVVEVAVVVLVAVVLVAVVLVAMVVVVTPDAPTHWIALIKTGEHWSPVDWS